MKILTAQDGGDFVVRLVGEIDHHSAALMRREIDEMLEKKKPSRLILDLGETDFMDSSGLGLILGRLRRCEENRVGLVLVNPTEAIMKILRLAGVDNMLEIRRL